MNWIAFFYVATASSLLTIIWQLVFNVYPAWRRVKIARALAVLARCLTKLNQDAFLNGRIHHEHDLHDQYYKFLFNVLTQKINLRFKMLKNIKHDKKAEQEISLFRAEIEKLDKETRELISSASFAVGKILMFRSPLILFLAYRKIKRERYSYLMRERCRMEAALTSTAEFITMNARDHEDYRLTPIHV